MRKIEHDMLAAIRHRSRWWETANTRVITNDDGTVGVYLHNHLIAIIHYDTDGQVSGMKLRTCGWVTSTTASRLHAIAMTFAGVAVGRKLGTMELRQRGEADIGFREITLQHTVTGWKVQP